MNNQIELSQLQCYLAFGLKMLNTKSGKIITLTGAERFPGNLLTMISYGSSYDTDLWPLKPLVIPLTSLTDQQWVEVFKAGFDNTDFDHSSQLSKVVAKADESVSVLYRGAVIRFIKSEPSFHHWPVRFNQLATFQKLFELHADVWGWVEAGLAEDKLEVGNENIK